MNVATGSNDLWKMWQVLYEGVINSFWFDSWARNFKCLWSPGIDSKEWIPPAYVVWRAGTITDNHIPPQFLAPIDFLKIPAQGSLKRLQILALYFCFCVAWWPAGTG